MAELLTVHESPAYRPVRLDSGRARVSNRWIWTLFALGLVHWLAFIFVVQPPSGRERDLIRLAAHPSQLLRKPQFSWEQGSLTGESWYIHMKQLSALQQGFRTRTLPYHVPKLLEYGAMVAPGMALPEAGRFFSMPDNWPVSPQIGLLSVLSLEDFVLFNWLALYIIGFYGCVLIARRYHLGWQAFTFLVVLFNLNGLITSNMATRMSEISGYFFIPYLILAVLEAGESDPRDWRAQWRVGLAMGIMLALIWWQGSAHPFIEWSTFLLFWSVVHWRRWRVPVVAWTVAFSMCAVRLLPAAVTWGAAKRYHLSNPGVFGFWAFDDYINGLAVAHSVIPNQDWTLYDYYVSIFGLAALAYLALWAPWKGASWRRFRGWPGLWVATGLTALCSFRRLKDLFVPPWVPLFNAEAWTSRYMLIPFTLLIVIAAINAQGAVERHWASAKMRWLMLGGMAVTTVSLLNHSRLWRIWVVAAQDWGWKYPERHTIAQVVNNPADTLYILSVHVGIAISIVATIAAVWAWWRASARTSSTETLS